MVMMGFFEVLMMLVLAVGIPLGIYKFVQLAQNREALPPGSGASTLRESELNAMIERAVRDAVEPMEAEIRALEARLASMERRLPPHDG